ncbi:unnamed protein product [Adineta steineri]|uniref:Aminotransferase class I/classII large domain-containing protein n=1 Tax=Adineta steineri TaxID=433720 RepID=A0A819EYH9_9BILA|nr:unnamed protein product [Adineta steineri]CAF3857920.1 unnamed protein product [Adineta steineri]
MDYNIDELESLSAFELKDVLFEIAKGSTVPKKILNAGRGNPNFLSTVARDAFVQLMLFAISESKQSSAYLSTDVGGFPTSEGIEGRFQFFLHENKDVNGIDFLRGVIFYVRDQLNFNVTEFLVEMCEGILGINYPVPDRMLLYAEKIVGHYIRKEMTGPQSFNNEFDLFAVEGGTGAMTCIFDSFRTNHLLKPGDKIALGVPIFTPYLEIPKLTDYQLEVVHICADKDQMWQYPKTELNKLLNPEIKAFFLINPSNPASVKLNDESLDYIASIVAKRSDLIIITDDVYATFADQFVSLFARCPRNTILVYSYSKYFGATGWRLGVIGIHRDNVLDEQIAILDAQKRDELHNRYKSIVTDPKSLKFIDRLVADSRSIALNHTAGLSTPQQVQMVLFSLFALMDTSDSYKMTLKKLIRARKRALYRGIGINFGDNEENGNDVGYYTILDLELLRERIYGQQFANHFLSNTKVIEFLVRLAREQRVILLPGHSFGVIYPSVRVSFANLNEADYENIGQSIRTVMKNYFVHINAETSNKPLSNSIVAE